MKRFTLITAFTLIGFLNSNGQDIITKKNGEDIQSKVIEITLGEVKYKKWDNQDGPLISIAKSEILMVRYQNGTKDIFNETYSPAAAKGETENYIAGQKDALQYYRGYKPASNGTLATGLLLSPLIGLVPAFATTSSAPEDINLQYPDPSKMKNQDYYSGYTRKAFQMKKQKVWTNWGITLGITTSLYLLLKR